jgi:hypothetical protein
MHLRVAFSSAAHETLEEQIAYCVRGSTASLLSDAELLDQCIQQKNWGAFEMVHVCLEIDTTYPHLRTLLNHSFSIFEGTPRADFFVSTQENEWGAKQREVAHLARQSYLWALQHGISKEEARSILPESIVSAKWYVTGSIRAWMQYIEASEDKLSRECVRVLEPLFPRIRALSL